MRTAPSRMITSRCAKDVRGCGTSSWITGVPHGCAGCGVGVASGVPVISMTDHVFRSPRGAIFRMRSPRPPGGGVQYMGFVLPLVRGINVGVVKGTVE